MARWRPRSAARIEAPAWYRTFEPAAWSEVDAQEAEMIDGSSDWRPWPDELHEIHARRRWGEARHAFRRAHPEFGAQEFNDLLQRHTIKRAARGW